MLVLLDLSYALDTIDHDHLFCVLEKYVGTYGNALNTTKSYFTNRTQRVQINVLSDFSNIIFGVPQESVFGPLKLYLSLLKISAILKFHGIGCCCRPTPPCLFGGVLPYFEVTGDPVPVSSLGFKCPYCFIWNCSYIIYERAIQGQLPTVFLPMIVIPDGGMCEGIHRAQVLDLVLIVETAIGQAPSVGLAIICMITTLNYISLI